MILLPSSPWYCNYKHAIPEPVYVILVMEPREVLHQVSTVPSWTLLVLRECTAFCLPTLGFGGEAGHVDWRSSSLLYFSPAALTAFFPLSFFSTQKFNYDLAQHRFLCVYPNWGLLIFLSLDIYVFCQILEMGRPGEGIQHYCVKYFLVLCTFSS